MIFVPAATTLLATIVDRPRRTITITPQGLRQSWPDRADALVRDHRGRVGSPQIGEWSRDKQSGNIASACSGDQRVHARLSTRYGGRRFADKNMRHSRESIAGEKRQ